jgi:hypothetical protein
MGGFMTIVIDGSGTITGAATLATTVTSPTLTTPTVTTTIGVGGATPSASGSGVTFPATQSASTNANTLDDYEEGTWTPTQGGGLTVVGTFSSAGTYTKIGRQVVVTGRVSGSTSVAVGVDVLTAGLPFTIVGTDVVGTMTNNAANVSVLNLGNSTTIYSCGSISATTNIFFSLTYFTS